MNVELKPRVDFFLLPRARQPTTMLSAGRSLSRSGDEPSSTSPRNPQ